MRVDSATEMPQQTLFGDLRISAIIRYPLQLDIANNSFKHAHQTKKVILTTVRHITRAEAVMYAEEFRRLNTMPDHVAVWTYEEEL